jgi:hypothetical protein
LGENRKSIKTYNNEFQGLKIVYYHTFTGVSEFCCLDLLTELDKPDAEFSELPEFPA